MTKNELITKLKLSYDEIKRLNFEIAERESIIDESKDEFPNVKELAVKLTIDAWLNQRSQKKD
jgi:hypothetical protein